MKKPIIRLLSLAILSLSIIVISPLKSSLLNSFNQVRNELDEDENEEEKEAGVEKEMMAWFQSRAYPDPYYLNDKYARAWQQALKLREQSNYSVYAKEQASNWVALGPSTGIGGRILCIEVNPVKRSSLLVGSASGGIWKSYNGGTNWQPVTTNTNVLGVTSIIINPSDTMIMYAGTGEVYRMDSTGGTANPGNLGVNVWKARGTYGVGILKSIDGGYTWSVAYSKSMANLFGIQRLRFDPTNYNTVYACATDGLYRTTNAGMNWTKILDVPYASDVVINAKAPNQIVAASGNFSNSLKGLWRTADGGSTWTKISSPNLPNFSTTVQGFTRLDNVPAPGNRDTIIASIGICETPSGTNELFRSTDFGLTWNVLGSSSHTQWQYWCAHDVAINPFATDSLLLGGVKGYRYKVSTATKSSALSIHDDVHDMKFDPLFRGTAYICGDGGVYKTTNGGTSWSQINTGLAATQFYASIGVSPAGASNNIIVGGLQDNGVVWSTDGGTTWGTYTGSYGDGAACAIDPTNGSKIITSGDARNFYLSTNGGSTASNTLGYLASGAPTTTHDSRTAFVAPVAYSKKKPSVVYVGTDNLHKSTDGGSTFTNNVTYLGNTTPSAFIEAVHKTALSIAVSPTDPNGDTLYISTSNFAQFDNDQDGLWLSGQPNLLKSTNGGATLPMTSVKGSLPNRFIMDIAMSPTNHDSVYVTLGGFGTSHIYVSPNGGITWNALGASLPDVPFNTLVFDPVNSKIIYAGSDLGVYVSSDRGLTWTDFNNGFWDATQIVDLQIDKNNKLLAATHGKGVFRSDLFTGSTLPVTLRDFNGSNQNDFNVLHWTCEQENGLDHYEVERSTDGIQYHAIVSVRSKNSQSETNYAYKDQVNSNSSEYYYRLKIVNSSGSFTYSAVIFIKVIGQNKFWVMQNPIQDNIVLQYDLSRNGRIKLSLINGTGALMLKEDYYATTGSGTYSMYGLDKYPEGIYYLRIESGSDQKTIKLVKRK